MLDSIHNLATCDRPARTEPVWPEAPILMDLPQGAAHIFAARLDESLANEHNGAILSKDEKERAGRFLFDIHRIRYVAGRSLVRMVLGRLLGMNPAKLRFTYSAAGKPALDSSISSNIKFNLSHSEDLALLAVTRNAEVGIDTEHIRPIPEAGELVARFFSSRESDLFNRLPATVQPIAFYNLWTRKEAWLKATGEGIAHSLKLVEVAFLPQEPARLLSVPGSDQSAARWTLRELHPAPGFAAAIAVASFPIQIRCFSWPTPTDL